MTHVPYSAALARVRQVCALGEGTPRVLESSLALEDRTRDAARAAFRSGVSFAALCADLGRVAVESLERDRLSAIAIGRAMVRWAATVYHVDGGSGQEQSAQ